jgi:hypothetical protein
MRKRRKKSVERGRGKEKSKKEGSGGHVPYVTLANRSRWGLADDCPFFFTYVAIVHQRLRPRNLPDSESRVSLVSLDS